MLCVEVMVSLSARSQGRSPGMYSDSTRKRSKFTTTKLCVLQLGPCSDEVYSKGPLALLFVFIIIFLFFYPESERGKRGGKTEFIYCV